ncbi:glycosyltransferase family 2 protein [Pseudarthrobacter scleromae]|uniref:Glycosyl hydrolase n=1 Tax=Pseudarthrobacter scleromae TaxID=158897 RepID=A0ABQ2CIM9_9MICC|nr:glycosyltransferase family 2 protein [Pseudarthrobacter scleromae]GGI83261.1 glycosyl hydrolase [Pseudarthrobacter scleromae]
MEHGGDGVSGEPAGGALTVSVVIPTRNDAAMLRVCLHLLSRQTRPADEIIVVDNASSDDTPAVCSAAGVRRIPVDVPGIPATTAAGFDAAAGDIIARLDTDSRPPADWLERVEAVLGAARPLSLVTGPGEFYGGRRWVRWAGRHVFLGGYFRVLGFLLGHTPVYGSNFALRRAVWQEIGGSVVRNNADVHDDLDISYHLRPEMTVIYDPTLPMGVSARPLTSWPSFRRHIRMSLVTFRVEFKEEPPLRRRLKRARARRSREARRRRAGTGDGG